MKHAFLIVLVLATHFCFLAAAKPAITNSPTTTQNGREVPGSDVIAFVRLTGTSSSTTKNKAGQQVRIFTCYATAERFIKGVPEKKIRWSVVTVGKQESAMEKSAVPALEQARLARPPGNPVFLVFLRRAGEAYRLNGTPGFTAVLSSGSLQGTDRVDWAGCRSVDEVSAAIQRASRR